jgi:hypothetical protein
MCRTIRWHLHPAFLSHAEHLPLAVCRLQAFYEFKPLTLRGQGWHLLSVRRKVAILTGLIVIAPLITVMPATAETASIVEYPVPGSGPNGIVAGPDGNLWFTDAGHSSIDRFTMGGALTIYPLPTSKCGPAHHRLGQPTPTSIGRWSA